MATSGFLDGLLARCSVAADFVRGLTGWRKALFAFVTGLASALAFPPSGLFVFLLLFYAALVWMIDGAVSRPKPLRGAFWAGWWFGFGQFLLGLYWIGYAFLVDPAQHGWQAPFAITLLPAGLALFPALAALACARFWRRDWSRALILTVFFAIAFYLRGHILSGFPWNLPAYGWGASLGLMQSMSVIGAYGLSLLTILLGASLALLGDRRRRDALLPATLSVLFLAIWGAGLVRLALIPTRYVPQVQLRLVQPDVPQDQKYVERYRLRNWQRLVDLSLAPAKIRPTDIIWPEAAPPFLLLRQPMALDEIAQLTRGRVLMTGAARVTPKPDGGYRFYNSFLMFGPGGKLLDIYNKFHLVPFGEYMPARGVVRWLGLSQLVDAPDGFTPGNGPHTFAVPHAPPAGPLICYEVIFPDAVVGAKRPGWFVNVTDDSWFGPPGSWGPQQHLLIARARAIEEGLPIARDANTGISAIIDPEGRILAELGSGKMGVVDGRLPQALPPTIYARLGDLLFFVLLVACALLAYSGQRRTRARIA